ncbi:MAG: dienelactone hydrolase family protein [Pseudomonadales bacterium]|jgi:carboxymethylenebutenolidase|nr:dienelactone hydrolase family protein [Pseudomonadales bacterium]
MGKPTLSAKDFSPEVLDAFDKYVHGMISRRDFLERGGKFAAGSSAAAILASLSPNYAQAQDIAEDDPRITTEKLIYPSPQNWQGYVAKPANATGPLPAVLVIHENRGRNPYVDDVTRRLAVAGFLAMAPDALTSFGGWPGNDDEGRDMQAQLDRDEMFQNWVAAVRYLQTRPDSNGKVGAVGFCYGGGIVNQLAATLPDLAAGVPYYGGQVSAEEAAKIKAPLLIHNGELDTRIVEGQAAFGDALTKAGVTFEAYVYPGANHGFHNNSTPRFDEAAADLSWERTIAWFNQYLR